MPLNSCMKLRRGSPKQMTMQKSFTTRPTTQISRARKSGRITGDPPPTVNPAASLLLARPGDRVQQQADEAGLHALRRRRPTWSQIPGRTSCRTQAAGSCGRRRSRSRARRHRRQAPPRRPGPRRENASTPERMGDAGPRPPARSGRARPTATPGSGRRSARGPTRAKRAASSRRGQDHHRPAAAAVATDAPQVPILELDRAGPQDQAVATVQHQRLRTQMLGEEERGGEAFLRRAARAGRRTAAAAADRPPVRPSSWHARHAALPADTPIVR